MSDDPQDAAGGRDDDSETLLEAVTALVPPLLSALDALTFAGRHLHPPNLPEVVSGVAGMRQPVVDGLATFEAIDWPEHLSGFAGAVAEAAREALEAYDGLEACVTQSNPALGAYRAMSFATRATEALYPVAFMLPPVSRFYLSDSRRGDAARQERLAAAGLGSELTGIVHAGNAKTERGGFSLYVPEDYDPTEPLPLVVALHGGSGHGRSFLWTWLKDARARRVILAAPTARGDTWALMGEDVDTANLHAIVDHVRERWAVDEARVLLTGMSDGGTFSYVTGLREDSPFTHLAPISASFHPLLLEGSSAARLTGLPVYLIHGALDWMFPVDVARMARDTLLAAGAALEYREIDDLSHTYPREENDRMLSWLLGREG